MHAHVKKILMNLARRAKQMQKTKQAWQLTPSRCCTQHVSNDMTTYIIHHLKNFQHTYTHTKKRLLFMQVRSPTVPRLAERSKFFKRHRYTKSFTTRAQLHRHAATNLSCHSTYRNNWHDLRWYFITRVLQLQVASACHTAGKLD